MEAFGSSPLILKLKVGQDCDEDLSHKHRKKELYQLNQCNVYEKIGSTKNYQSSPKNTAVDDYFMQQTQPVLSNFELQHNKSFQIEKQFKCNDSIIHPLIDVLQQQETVRTATLNNRQPQTSKIQSSYQYFVNRVTLDNDPSYSKEFSLVNDIGLFSLQSSNIKANEQNTEGYQKTQDYLQQFNQPEYIQIDQSFKPTKKRKTLKRIFDQPKTKKRSRKQIFSNENINKLGSKKLINCWKIYHFGCIQNSRSLNQVKNKSQFKFGANDKSKQKQNNVYNRINADKQKFICKIGCEDKSKQDYFLSPDFFNKQQKGNAKSLNFFDKQQKGTTKNLKQSSFQQEYFCTLEKQNESFIEDLYKELTSVEDYFIQKCCQPSTKINEEKSLPKDQLEKSFKKQRSILLISALFIAVIVMNIIQICF